MESDLATAQGAESGAMLKIATKRGGDDLESRSAPDAGHYGDAGRQPAGRGSPRSFPICDFALGTHRVILPRQFHAQQTFPERVIRTTAYTIVGAGGRRRLSYEKGVRA
jgi:hypothetical protein